MTYFSTLWPCYLTVDLEKLQSSVLYKTSDVDVFGSLVTISKKYLRPVSRSKQTDRQTKTYIQTNILAKCLRNFGK